MEPVRFCAAKVAAIRAVRQKCPSMAFMTERAIQSEAVEAAQIPDRMEGWERVSTIQFHQYGKQRAWVKRGNGGATEATHFLKKKCF